MTERRLPAPVPATILPLAEFADHDDLKPGTIAFEGTPPRSGVLWTVCPCGCGERYRLPIRRAGEVREGWDWNGSIDKPTLGPSIRHHTAARDRGRPEAGRGSQKTTVHWHGWLRDGVWVQA